MNFNQDFGSVASQTVEVIGFGRRLVAYIIDSIVLSIVGGIIGGVFGALIALLASAGSEDIANAASLLVNCLSLLIGLAYFVVFWATTGQTLGKMAMGIKVIGIDGTPVTWGKAILRYIGYIISGLVLALGFIWIAFDSKRQGWHDKIAGTYVVRKETQFSPMDNVTFVPSDPDGGWIWAVVAVVFILMPICVIAILLLLGPAIGEVFSNIVEELGTPSPR